MLRSIFGCSLLALGALTGCTSTGESGRSSARHTVHVWELDREATQKAAVSYTMERTQPEARDERAAYFAQAATSPMFGADAYLELVSDGTYRWQSSVGEDLFVSEGIWSHNETRSGARIYLHPDEAKLEDKNAESGIGDWMLLVNTDQMQLKIVVPGSPGPVMRRAD